MNNYNVRLQGTDGFCFCCFTWNLIGGYTIDMSISNQSVHGFLTFTVKPSYEAQNGGRFKFGSILVQTSSSYCRYGTSFGSGNRQ